MVDFIVAISVLLHLWMLKNSDSSIWIMHWFLIQAGPLIPVGPLIQAAAWAGHGGRHERSSVWIQLKAPIHLSWLNTPVTCAWKHQCKLIFTNKKSWLLKKNRLNSAKFSFKQTNRVPNTLVFFFEIKHIGFRKETQAVMSVSSGPKGLKWICYTWSSFAFSCAIPDATNHRPIVTRYEPVSET